MLENAFHTATKVIYEDFELTISLKKTNTMGQDTEALIVITIDDY